MSKQRAVGFFDGGGVPVDAAPGPLPWVLWSGFDRSWHLGHKMGL